MNNLTLTSACILVIGLCIQFIAQEQADLVMVTLIFMLSGLLLIIATNKQCRYELNAYLLTFATNLFWTSIAAIYRVHLNDPHQLDADSDSSRFYALASNIKSSLPLDELRYISDGSGAIYIWRELYRATDYFGIKADAHIGISFNILLVALTAVLAIKIVKTIWGNDHYRLVKMTYLYSLCGIVWLYAANHLRDSFILFTTTLLFYLWIKFLVFPKLKYAAMVAVVSIAWILNYKYMRIEYQYVPLTVASAGIVAWFLCTKNVLSKIALSGVLLIFGMLIMLNYGYMTSIKHEVKVGKTWSSSSSSLGSKYVVNAPLPVRATVGTYYIHVFPIPFWAGFQLSTAYHLFKSLNAVYMLFVVPMGIVGAIRAMSLNRNKRSPPLLFSLIFYFGFAMTVAITSLEGRHLGAFIVAFLILAIAPDFRTRHNRKRLANWTVSWIGIAALVHAAWFALKY
jgi:hypothetical protein